MSVKGNGGQKLRLRTRLRLHGQQGTHIISFDVVICSFDFVIETRDTSNMFIGKNGQGEIDQKN
jgi:hypothetical protein